MSYETPPNNLEGERTINQLSIKYMKRNIITVAAIGAILLGGFVLAQAEQGQRQRGGGRWHGHGGHGFGMEHMIRGLDLTPEQQTKVQPIIDQAKPQIVAIHQEAKQKTKTVIDGAVAKIRPILTPAQQKKFDDLQAARQEMQNARQKLHDAMRE